MPLRVIQEERIINFKSRTNERRDTMKTIKYLTMAALFLFFGAVAHNNVFAQNQWSALTTISAMKYNDGGNIEFTLANNQNFGCLLNNMFENLIIVISIEH